MLNPLVRTALLCLGLSLFSCALSTCMKLYAHATTSEKPSVGSLSNDPADEAHEAAIQDDTDLPEIEWRRTVNGWEPKSAFTDASLSPPASALHLHPLVVASLQGLLSIGALLLFEYTDEDESTDLIQLFTR